MKLKELKLKLYDIVGKENLIYDPNKLKNYAQDFHYPLVEAKDPELIIMPKTIDEIQKIIQIASEFKFPIIPRSSKLSRYGGTIPEDGGLIVDLQKMNQILSIDNNSMYVVIEPGVTFKQLQVELDKVGLRIIPTIFSSSDSIISSYLARYPFFAMLKFEYNDLVVNLEVVLGSDIFRTGSMASSKSPPVYPYGSTLDYFRIFHGARGGLGIVTKASIRVKPKPQIQEIMSIPFQNHSDLINFVYRVERKEIGTECIILNKFNALEYLNIENKATKFPNWVFLICLEGLERFPEEKIAYEKDALNEIIKENSLKKEKNELISQLEGKILKEFNSPDGINKQHYDLPLYITLNKFSGLLSAISDELRKFNDFSIDLGVSIIPIERNRVAYIEFDFYTDLKNGERITKFRKLFSNLGELALKSGAFIDIPYGPLKKIVYSKVGSYSKLINKIKDIFDPNKIMNPGKIEWEAR
ncbi:MAG: FAD-binding oxidoreductase [Candidatus Hodarchaeota archaeon]